VAPTSRKSADHWHLPPSLAVVSGGLGMLLFEGRYMIPLIGIMGRSKLEPLPWLADRHENVCWCVEKLTELCPLESIEISHNQGVAMCVVRWSNATQAGRPSRCTHFRPSSESRICRELGLSKKRCFFRDHRWTLPSQEQSPEAKPLVRYE